MSIRARFDDELSYLNTELIKMGALCERAVTSALEVFLQHDKSKVSVASKLEKEIDAKERDIEDLCMKLIPVSYTHLDVYKRQDLLFLLLSSLYLLLQRIYSMI